MLRILREVAAVAEPIVAVESEGQFTTAARAIPCQVLVRELGVLRRSYLHPVGLLNRAWLSFTAALSLASLIRRQDVQLVFTSTVSVLAGALAARLTRRPHLWFVQEILSGTTARLAPAVTALSDQILAVSKASAQSIHRGRAAAMRKTVVHYPGVDAAPHPGAEAAAFRKRFAAPDALLIGMVGRLHFWKGQDHFLDALHQLRQRGLGGFRALIIGDVYPGYEELGRSLRQKASDLGLNDMVTFCGHIAEMEPVYQALDVVVAPSTLPEPFGLVVAEGMAAGRAVIATNAGGPSEMIEDGVSGLLVPPANPAVLSERLESLLRDADLREQLGQHGRRRIELFPARAFDGAVRSLVERALSGRVREQAVAAEGAQEHRLG